MANTRDLGRLFFRFARLHTLTGKRPALMGLIPSQETDEPFRMGAGIYIRLPFSNLALVLGIWMDSGFGEDEALYNAMSGRGFEVYGADVVDLSDPDVRDAVRRTIAENSKDLDEEWTVGQVLLGDDPEPEYSYQDEDDTE